ncbi:hypothetical protein GUJ93_ZPchr0015g6821 [Zizania palustris]|uniref:Uncharacterized protein n=1 Tax=Zizania palustris TaxID=103762 RepID=A0A8J5W0Z9_ZIZPA|nr:hypothetical protein GUJ93_ZPchr0015g6821 [Zizania palustris]
MATMSTLPLAASVLPPAARASFSTLRPPAISLSHSVAGRGRGRLAATSKGAADNTGQEEGQELSASAVDGAANGKEESGKEVSVEKSPEAVAAELKEVLRARKEAEAASSGGWWAGVAQEMAEIEWPAPGKVVGTTGVVLGVIAGSTAALLSVNALLAELSDRVFAGRGLQDFF